MIMNINTETLQDFQFRPSTPNVDSTPLFKNIQNPHHYSLYFTNTDSIISFAHYPPESDPAILREMFFRISAMQPIHIDPESVKAPKRRNVKISKDPQSVAARRRREKISERIRILQRIVPGGTKLDTASMLDEAVHYVKFLKSQLQSLKRVTAAAEQMGFPVAMCSGSYFAGISGETSSSVQSHQQQMFTLN